MPADTASIEDEEFETPPKPAAKPAPVAKKPESEPVEPAKKHTHSSRLVKAATEAGFTQDDLDNFPSDVIWEELHRIQSITIKTAPVAQPEVKKPEVDPEEAYLAELEATHAPLANMLRQSKTKLAAMEKAQTEKDEVIGKLTQAEQKRQQAAFDRALDKAFAALPEEYAEYVGTGSIHDLTDPGHMGFRGAIYKAAKLEATDSLKQIAAKIEAAAKSIVGPRIKQVADTTSAYDKLPARKPQPKDAKGKFTVEEFANGQVHRPAGKKTGLEGLSLEEGARRIMKEHGDPRGDRPVIEMDDEEFEGT